MAASKAGTVASYLAELPAERREVLTELRQLILDRLPAGFEERMEFGMPSYVVPLARYPKTYNGRPLMLAALASQKQHMALYLLSVYGDPERWFSEAFQRAGKRLDMGKSCLRFKSLKELPLPVIGDAIERLGVDEFIALHERARGPNEGAASKRKVAKKATSKKAAQKRAAGKSA